MLGARESDVQHSHVLAPGFLLGGKTVALLPRALAPDVEPDGVSLVIEQEALVIALQQLAIPHVRKQHDGVLQPLALVKGDDAGRVCVGFEADQGLFLLERGSEAL